ncbi:MAG: helix-turn-helix transcriptional regulator [Clostridia bacterium]|nr:helix-turn-helix transcriptional regulator [Clostridia bacterium]
MNTTLKSYVNGLRLNEAKRLLKTTDKNVTDIAIEAGFNTIRSFNRAFFAEMGETPTEYRKNKNKA